MSPNIDQLRSGAQLVTCAESSWPATAEMRGSLLLVPLAPLLLLLLLLLLRASPCHQPLTSMRGHECLCYTILHLIIIGHFFFLMNNSTDLNGWSKVIVWSKFCRNVYFDQYYMC